MKNANGKGFNKDRRQSSLSQFKSQDKGKKDTRDGGQHTIPLRPKCFGYWLQSHETKVSYVSQDHWEEQDTCCYLEQHRA